MDYGEGASAQHPPQSLAIGGRGEAYGRGMGRADGHTRSDGLRLGVSVWGRRGGAEARGTGYVGGQKILKKPDFPDPHFDPHPLGVKWGQNM